MEDGVSEFTANKLAPFDKKQLIRKEAIVADHEIIEDEDGFIRGYD